MAANRFSPHLSGSSLLGGRVNHQALIEFSAEKTTFQPQLQAFYVYILHVKRGTMPWLIYVYDKKIYTSKGTIIIYFGSKR